MTGGFVAVNGRLWLKCVHNAQRVEMAVLVKDVIKLRIWRNRLAARLNKAAVGSIFSVVAHSG